MNKKHISKYHGFLLKQPIFKNIGKHDLDKLFNLMQIKQYKKSEVVNFEANKHSKLYIIYEGLFKLNKVDKNGDEVVLRIVDKNNVVLPMYFSPYYDVCASFIKNTILFSFSKEAINTLIDKNHQFSLNIINLLADNIQGLMLSSEILQLKSTKEKVGWYLTYAKINNAFKLPYSKALIAAYLGMKPESFSRALSNLRKDGIIINNKLIKLEKGNELCKYCDKITGSNCSFFKTERCIH